MAQKIEISSPESTFSEAVVLLREYSHRLNSELASALSVGQLATRRVKRPCSNMPSAGKLALGVATVGFAALILALWPSFIPDQRHLLC
jgi:hypothetical protein